jgi:hypothetical protein
MFENYSKGQIAVLKVQLRAAEKGVAVAIPTVEMRYDMIVDDGTLRRAQVKYVAQEETDGSVTLDLRKETRGNGKKRTYSRDEIDMVLAYIPAVDKIICFGPEVFEGRQTITIRFKQSETKKKRRKGIHFIEDYLW